MSIKTTVEYVPSSLGARYPYYGQFIFGDTIVLFVKERCGVLMKKGNINGEYREDWCESNFNPINVVEVVLRIAE